MNVDRSLPWIAIDCVLCYTVDMKVIRRTDIFAA